MNPIIFTLLIIIGSAVFLTGGIVMVLKLRRQRQDREIQNGGRAVSLANDTPVIEMGDSFFGDKKEEVKPTVEETVEKEIQAKIDAEQVVEAEDDASDEVEVETIEDDRVEEVIEAEVETDPESESTVEEVDFATESENVVGEKEIEDEEVHPELPAYAARAPVPVPSEPLFKVAPPSVPNTAVEMQPAISETPKVEPENVEVTTESEAVAEDETKSEETTQAAGDYSFEEVPEEIEPESVLDQEVTHQIEELDSELNLLESLVTDIERSLADFEPATDILLEDENAASQREEVAA